MKKQITRIISSILLCGMILTFAFGCTPRVNWDEETILKEQENFNSFLDEIFISDVSSNTISLHYTLKDPSVYGLGDMEPKLYSSFGESDNENGEEESLADTLKAIKAFSYKHLTEDQQLIYRILVEYVEMNISAEGLDYYGSYLDMINGAHVNMPVNLAEYKFYSEKDVTDYLALLKQFPDYFTMVADYEEKRVDLGMGLSDVALTEAINSCNSFLTEKENNFLILTFNEKIKTVAGLSEDKIAKYVADSRNSFMNYVVPAYESLISKIETFFGKGTNDGGICNYEKGKAYYSYLTSYYSGSNKSVDEIYKIIEKKVASYITQVKALQLNNLALFTEVYNAFYSDGDLGYKLTDPNEILEYLKTAITDDYPAIENFSYVVNSVQKSMEDMLSPAFYMIPPIDDYENNVIYINYGSVDANSIFSTLAHEGLPGHLYQTVYFNSTNPHPVRSILDFSGYVEGWASYAEYDSYYMYDLGANSNFKAKLIQLLNQYSTAVSALMDIAVNYYGWTKEDVDKYFGGQDMTGLFNIVVQSPATYLKYCVGYLEIMELREYAESELGGKFTAIGFNKAFLDVGPAQFDIIKDYIKKYVAEAKKA